MQGYRFGFGLSMLLYVETPFNKGIVAFCINISFFFNLSYKVMIMVSNTIYIGAFTNSLASSDGLFGNFGLSSERYGIDLLIKLAKYFIALSSRTPTPFRVLIEYWQGFTF